MAKLLAQVGFLVLCGFASAEYLVPSLAQITVTYTGLHISYLALIGIRTVTKFLCLA